MGSSPSRRPWPPVQPPHTETRRPRAPATTHARRWVPRQRDLCRTARSCRPPTRARAAADTPAMAATPRPTARPGRAPRRTARPGRPPRRTARRPRPTAAAPRLTAATPRLTAATPRLTAAAPRPGQAAASTATPASAYPTGSVAQAGRPQPTACRRSATGSPRCPFRPGAPTNGAAAVVGGSVDTATILRADLKALRRSRLKAWGWLFVTVSALGAVIYFGIAGSFPASARKRYRADACRRSRQAKYQQALMRLGMSESAAEAAAEASGPGVVVPPPAAAAATARPRRRPPARRPPS